MNRNTKIILGIVIGTIMLCLCVVAGGIVGLRIAGEALVKNTLSDNPEQARQAARSMADYDLPAGYKEELVVSWLVFKAVAIMSSQKEDMSQPIIVFMQFSDAMKMDDDEIRNQLRQGWQGNYDMKFVEEKQVVIRGQATTLHVYEGVDDKGTQIRQVISGAFKGKEKNLVLIIEGPIQNWNQDTIDKFIKSIR